MSYMLFVQWTLCSMHSMSCSYIIYITPNYDSITNPRCTRLQIETMGAIEQLEDILKHCDGILLNRNYLIKQLPLTRVYVN